MGRAPVTTVRPRHGLAGHGSHHTGGIRVMSAATPTHRPADQDAPCDIMGGIHIRRRFSCSTRARKTGQGTCVEVSMPSLCFLLCVQSWPSITKPASCHHATAPGRHPTYALMAAILAKTDGSLSFVAETHWHSVLNGWSHRPTRQPHFRNSRARKNANT